MDAVLMKYSSHNQDYLVLDTAKNQLALDGRTVRSICARNFGIGSLGILAGAATARGVMDLKMYQPDGRECRPGQEEQKVFSRYMLDAGYLGTGSAGDDGAAAMMVGKIFLMEDFFTRNGIGKT